MNHHYRHFMTRESTAGFALKNPEHRGEEMGQGGGRDSGVMNRNAKIFKGINIRRKSERMEPVERSVQKTKSKERKKLKSKYDTDCSVTDEELYDAVLDQQENKYSLDRPEALSNRKHKSTRYLAGLATLQGKRGGA